MLFFVAMIYLIGGAVTARCVLSGQSSGQGLAVSAGEIALWPLYWAWFLFSSYLGRKS